MPVPSCLQEGRDRRMQVANKGPKQKEQVCDTRGQKEVSGISGEPGQVHKDDDERKGEDEGSLGKDEERTGGADGSQRRVGEAHGKGHNRPLEVEDQDV